MADINKRSGNPDCEDEGGEDGDRGKRGKRGHRGHQGPRGHDGHDGATGSTGPMGLTGATGPAGEFLYFTFPIVTVVGAVDAAFDAAVVPETPLIVIPAGWNVVARATVGYVAQTLVANLPSPTPNPPAGQIYGGLSGVAVREDPSGANVARASNAEVLAFSLFSLDGVNTRWNAAGVISAVGSFVSNGAPHTYAVRFTSPRYVAVTQSVIGNPNVNDIRLGLELFASPP